MPSYGASVGRAAVQAEHDMCELLFDRFFDRVRKGETNEDMLAAGIMEGTGRTWNDPAKFVPRRAQGLLGPQQHFVARYRMKHLSSPARCSSCALRPTRKARSRT